MTPDDERKRIKERDRGAEAERIFESSVWQESYEHLVQALMAKLVSPETDDEVTLEIKRRLNALHSIKRQLETVLQTGKMATEQLEAAKRG
jgi:hypothetical protein